MIWLALTAIFVLFVLFAFLRGPVQKISGLKICSICAAVSLTWITLLILKFVGVAVSNLLLGILMGESITGIMYLFERHTKKQGKTSLLWLKVVIIILGTLLVYLLLTQGFSTYFIVVLIISTIIAVIIYWMIYKKNSKKPVNKKHSKFQSEIKKLEEKLEHCCD